MVFGIVAIVLVLADLQSTGTAEHHEDDANVPRQNHNPLAHSIRALCCDKMIYKCL